MQPSKLQLDHYFIDEVSFRLKDTVIKKQSAAPPTLSSEDLDIEVRTGENKLEERKRFCQVEIKLKEKKKSKYVYDFKVVLIGFFELSSECTETESAILMTNTAPSMLFTAAREYLLLITGRTRFLPIKLPTVMFAPTQKSVQARSGAKRAPAKTARRNSPNVKKSKN